MSVLACGWGLICGVPGAGWGLAAGGGAPDGALEITAPGERGTGAGYPEVGGWAAVAGPGRAGPGRVGGVWKNEEEEEKAGGGGDGGKARTRPGGWERGPGRS